MDPEFNPCSKAVKGPQLRDYTYMPEPNAKIPSGIKVDQIRNMAAEIHAERYFFCLHFISAVPRRSFPKNRSTASTTHDPNQTSTVSRKPPSKKVRSLATKSLPIHDGHLPPKPNLRRHLPLNSNLRRPGAVKVAKTTSCKKDQFQNSSHPSRPLGSSNDQERKIAQIVGETDSGDIGSDLSKRHMSESSTNIQVTHKPPVLTQPPSSLKPSQTHPTQSSCRTHCHSNLQEVTNAAPSRSIPVFSSTDRLVTAPTSRLIHPVPSSTTRHQQPFNHQTNHFQKPLNHQHAVCANPLGTFPIQLNHQATHFQQFYLQSAISLSSQTPKELPSGYRYLSKAAQHKMYIESHLEPWYGQMLVCSLVGKGSTLVMSPEPT
ncbi:hypothetical protein PSHT_08563 [Puccinia striiformis]|uniref:Uncharacterized protein n=1 Tax=Puccinia striiformis TaxID=27350 RepID=A0A2S4VN58_9BASI|nr:hypothetical protein PSHT_08563 [Puccinia striiformis]